MNLRLKHHPLYVSFALAMVARAGTPPGPTFDKDVLPLLQTRCQPCHRPGELGPMPLTTLEQVRPFGKKIVERMKAGTMPPWYSNKCCGQFSPDHVLKPEEIATIESWVNAGMPEGKKKDLPRPVRWIDEWRIDGPSVVISLPRAFEVPAKTDIPDQLVIFALDLAEDRWASAVEIHPGDRSVVHSAVLYVRSKDSPWLRDVPKLAMTPAPNDADPSQLPGVEILAVYSPGNPAAVWPDGAGKKLPAGSDLVLQLHYESKAMPASDRTSVGINFMKTAATRRVLTFLLQDRTLRIPANSPDYKASITTTLTRDMTLLGIFAHTHQRGQGFTLAAAPASGKAEMIIDVSKIDPLWQPAYPLKSPRALGRGTRLIWTANYSNPDPQAAVPWGEKSSAEPMSAYIDVAVDPSVDRIAIRP